MKLKQRKGRFVLATNELDETVLSDAQLLEVYKDQGVTVERRFRFLKKPERIMALLMVMTFYPPPLKPLKNKRIKSILGYQGAVHGFTKRAGQTVLLQGL